MAELNIRPVGRSRRANPHWVARQGRHIHLAELSSRRWEEDSIRPWASSRHLLEARRIQGVAHLELRLADHFPSRPCFQEEMSKYQAVNCPEANRPAGPVLLEELGMIRCPRRFPHYFAAQHARASGEQSPLS
jgi:hypothetical protein